MTVQAKTLILLNFFIADSPAKHQQSGKLGRMSFAFHFIFHCNRPTHYSNTTANALLCYNNTC